jgi:AraC family transcriptional regulator
MSRSRDALSYSERLDRVAEHIAAHLAEPVDLLRLAEVAHLSPYHFHRLYHAINGETLATSVKRLRLQRAAGYLIQTPLGIAEIAKRTGLGSVAAFTRIFKTEYGLPPAQYRKQGSHTRFEPVAETITRLHREVRVLELPSLYGVCAEHTGSYLMIERAFDRVYRWAQARGLMSHLTHVLGVYDDDPFAVPESKLRSRAVLIFDHKVEAEAPLQTLELRGGDCAVLRHQGPYADMRIAYQWLYGQWLPQSGFEVANVPVFEVYLNHPRTTAPADLLVDIYLPLQST